MTCHQHLELYYRTDRLRTFRVPPWGMTVGSSPGCDIALPDPRCPPLACLIRPTSGVLHYRWLHGSPSQPELHLPLEESLRFGPCFRIRRPKEAPRATPDAATPPALEAPAPVRAYRVFVGESSTARSLRLDRRLTIVGTDPSCDLVLSDPAVNPMHLAIYAARGGVVLRDLASTTGTWLQGTRLSSAVLYHGSQVQIGRTQLLLRGTLDHEPAGGGGLKVHSSRLAEAVSKAERFGPLPWPVLIRGESGVGKELFAERIHQSGPRGQGPLIRFNAAALSPSLQEAQLFGHEEGAYTGAVGQRKGLFGEADRGTLFIDEVGEMPLGTQAKLLRALETGRITRVGGSVEMPVDVRVVCATHRDLEGMVARGEFREDLYFRIAQLQLRIPPLRERRRDIEPLAQAFLSEAAKYTGTRAFTKGALRALHRHPWHGNVRELRNVVREVAASSDALHIGQEAIEARLSRTHEAKKRASHPHSNLTILLQRHHGNVAAAARELGVPRSTLRDRLRRQRCG